MYAGVCCLPHTPQGHSRRGNTYPVAAVWSDEVTTQRPMVIQWFTRCGVCTCVYFEEKPTVSTLLSYDRLCKRTRLDGFINLGYSCTGEEGIFFWSSAVQLFLANLASHFLSCSATSLNTATTAATSAYVCYAHNHHMGSEDSNLLGTLRVAKY